MSVAACELSQSRCRLPHPAWFRCMSKDLQTRLQEGLAAQRAGHFSDAAACYEAVLKVQPDHFDALQLWGVLRFRAGDLAGGLVLLERALAIVPTHGPTLNNYGNALRQGGRHVEALRAYRAALARLPAPNAVLLRNLGSGLLEVGEQDEAAQFLEAAHRLDPRDPVLWCWIGMLESMRERPQASAAAYREAQRLDLTQGDAWHQAALGLASAAISERRYGDAERALAAILTARPSVLARIGRLQLAQRLARWAGWADDVIALGREAQGVQIEHEGLMQALYVTDDPAMLRSCAEAVARFHTQRTGPVQAPLPRRRDRLRIGYLSGDMRNHVVAWLFAEVLLHRDRSQFEVTVYALGPADDSAVRHRIQSAADRFIELGALSAADMRARIVADEIDILVDLAGYTEHSRPRVLALRPAPIQVGWLGYPGTMGGNLIDYLIADEVVLPVALEGGYSERIVRLPGSCLPNHANRPIGPPRPKAQLGLPMEGVVLCAFVPTVKITPPLFDLWMSILRERPATCLWLQQAHDEAINNLRHEAQLRGVTPDRLIFAAFEADHAAHLSRYEVADIALDTYPYGSHSTAADALWVGCPLVSRQGLSFAARVSSSALSAVGLAELIAVTDLDYKNLVLRLVDDAAHRAVLRQRLRAARENALLFDSVAYARHLDRAYLEMQRQALRGQPPQSFLVPA